MKLSILGECGRKSINFLLKDRSVWIKPRLWGSGWVFLLLFVLVRTFVLRNPFTLLKCDSGWVSQVQESRSSVLQNWKFVIIAFKMSSLSVLFFHCSLDDLKSHQYLALDPNVSGVYNGPYPFGIDPVSSVLFNCLLVMTSLCPLDFGMCISKINLTMKKLHFCLHSLFNKTFIWQRLNYFYKTQISVVTSIWSRILVSNRKSMLVYSFCYGVLQCWFAVFFFRYGIWQATVSLF